MKTDLFKCLPPEIVTNILLRLPVETIASSKCVCKPWRDLLETDYFVNSHLSKSLPSLAVMNINRTLCCCQVLEFEDQQLDDVRFQYKRVTKFDFPQRARIVGAANGLLLLRKVGTNKDILLYICNPITRHYVEIPGPKMESMDSRGAFGFGVSRITGQYKVVGIDHKSQCCVYTLGTGSWRRIAVETACALLLLKLDDYISAFLDGNLHWSVNEFDSRASITCFDLETECFSSFLAPAPHGGLSVVRDCLCFWELKDEEIVVWMMKEYGVEKSWSKDYVITQDPLDVGYSYDDDFLINVFENGDMLLMLLEDMCLRYYSNKTKTFHDYGIIDERRRFTFVSSVLFTPSFQTLKSLGMENVISF